MSWTESGGAPADFYVLHAAPRLDEGRTNALHTHLVLRMRDEALVTSDEGGRYSLVHTVHSNHGSASSTAPDAVNGPPVSRSLVHSPSNSIQHTVNGVNERNRATAAQLYTLHKAGNVDDPDLNRELDALFAEKRASKPDKARILEIAATVLP